MGGKLVALIVSVLWSVGVFSQNYSFEDRAMLRELQEHNGVYVKKSSNNDGTEVVTTYRLCYSCKGENRCSACGGLGGGMRYGRYMSCFHCKGNGRCATCYQHGYTSHTIVWNPQTKTGWYIDQYTGQKHYVTTLPKESYDADDNNTDVEKRTLYRNCVSCGGSGSCKYCNKGYYVPSGLPCKVCKKTGICNICNGAGKRIERVLK